MDYSAKLTHVAQYHTFSNTNDGYGDMTTATTITTIPCFVFYNEKRRLIDGVEQTGRDSWSVLLPIAMSTICQGDRLIHIVDGNGLVVFESARMKDLYIYRHWNDGVQVVQADLGLN